MQIEFEIKSTEWKEAGGWVEVGRLSRWVV